MIDSKLMDEINESAARGKSTLTERGKGLTTMQMRAAEQGSIYVWCNQYTDYARDLARHLGRIDLIIVSKHWLDLGGPWRGKTVKGLVIDHACELNREQRDNAEILLHRALHT